MTRELYTISKQVKRCEKEIYVNEFLLPSISKLFCIVFCTLISVILTYSVFL